MSRFTPVIRLLTIASALAWTAGCGEPPVVSELIPAMTIFVGDTVTTDLSEHFSDPDGDALTYEASSSAPEVVAASTSGSTLRIVPQRKGAARLEVTATDGGDLPAQIEVSVTVGNRPPQIVDPIASLEPHVAQKLVLVISEHIVDPDGDPVVYTATSTNQAVIRADLSGDTVRLEAVTRGDARIWISVTDDDSLTTNMNIPATVVAMPPRAVLMSLYDAAGGTGWGNRDNWGTDADLATWYGVEVDRQGRVRSLSLGGNNLKGTITPYLGELDALEELNLEKNPGLAGQFGDNFRQSLDALKVLLTGGTDLCAPTNDVFRRWLDRIAERRVKMCRRVPPTAYLIQAAQSAADSVGRIPLVGGKQALLRVFATSSHSTHEGDIPAVKATFYVDDDVIHTVTIPGKAGPVPVYRAERSLQATANVMIPGDVMRPDLEMVVEIDPDGTVDQELDVAARVPEDGRLEHRVYNLATFDLTVIPFLWKTDPDSAAIDIAEEMEEDREEQDRLHAVFDLLPIKDLEVTAFDPVETSSNDLRNILPQVEVIRRRDGGDGYFKGLLTGRRANGILGIAYLGGRSSASIPAALVMSHELGHNLFLRHAACGGGADPDTRYPYGNSRIGNWGYDHRKEELVNPSRYYDMMSYCNPQWISDYNFNKLIRYRRARSYQERRAPSAATQTLLLWGGLDEQGEPYLNPAFVMDAHPGLPASPGAYTLTAADHDGPALVSLSFDMLEVADAPGRSSHFVFTVPVQAGWAGSLASITLSGPEGSVTLDGDTDMPMTIAVDGRSGPIRAFWDGLRDTADARAGWVLLRSSGIPGREEWER